MKRTIYFVRSYGGKWKVKKEGAEREHCVCDTKHEGIRIARKLAEEVAPAQIIIENDDGTFQQEWTRKDCSVLFKKSGRQRRKQ